MPHRRPRIGQTKQGRRNTGHHPHHRQQIRIIAKVLPRAQADRLKRATKALAKPITVADFREHFRRPGCQPGKIEGEPEGENFQPALVIFWLVAD